MVQISCLKSVVYLPKNKSCLANDKANLPRAFRSCKLRSVSREYEHDKAVKAAVRERGSAAVVPCCYASPSNSVLLIKNVLRFITSP